MLVLRAGAEQRDTHRRMVAMRGDHGIRVDAVAVRSFAQPRPGSRRRLFSACTSLGVRLAFVQLRGPVPEA